MNQPEVCPIGETWDSWELNPSIGLDRYTLPNPSQFWVSGNNFNVKCQIQNYKPVQSPTELTRIFSTYITLSMESSFGSVRYSLFFGGATQVTPYRPNYNSVDYYVDISFTGSMSTSSLMTGTLVVNILDIATDTILDTLTITGSQAKTKDYIWVNDGGAFNPKADTFKGEIVGQGLPSQCQALPITRGLRFYNVWAGTGTPVANPALGITVEDWNGTSVAIMTIDETSNKLAEKWDTGFTSKSDMRSYPTVQGGSGGKLTLNDDGWYKTLESAGYSLAGSRVERTWNAGTEQKFSQGFVGTVKSGLGVLTVTVSDIASQMDDKLTEGEPFVTGYWVDAIIPKGKNSWETKLSDGMVFKNATSTNYPVQEVDETNAPIRYKVIISPTNADFPWELEFPTNSYCRISSGHNEGVILKVDSTIAQKITTGGRQAFGVNLSNSYGVPIDDLNKVGIVTSKNEIGVSITDMSTYEFFTMRQEFAVSDEVTVHSPITVKGEKVSNFEHENNVVVLSNQFLSNPIQDVKVVNNDSFDMTSWLDLPSGASSWDRSQNGYWANVVGLVSIDNALTPLNNKSIVGHKMVTTVTSSPNPDHYWWGHRTAMALSYSATNVPADTEGLCIDMAHHIPTLPTSTHAPITMRTKVVCVCVWDGDGVWASQSHTQLLQEKTFDLVLSTEGVATNELDGHTLIKNFGADYFTDALPNRQMEQFDNRTSSKDVNGLTYYRGRLSMKFDDNALLGAYPDRVYILVEAMCPEFRTGMDYTGTGNAELYVNEIGFYGKASTDSADEFDEITASVTGSSSSTLTTAIRKVATAQDWSSFKDTVINVSVPSAPVKSYILKANELKTKQALKRILREAWSVGYINRSGEYNVVSVAGKMGSTDAVPDTHNFVLPNGCELVGELEKYESDDFVTGGTINYNRDSQGKFANSITITDADKAVFDPSYAKGFDSEATAKILWDKCHLIWLKTGVLVDVRKDMQELWWLYKEDDAVNYFTNVVEWNGGGAFARDIVTASIRVADFDSTGVLPWNIGDACRLTVPNKLVGYYSGVVEGVKYEFGFGAIVYIRVAEVTQ